LESTGSQRTVGVEGTRLERLTSCILYYHGQMVFMLYMDDSIYAGPNKGEITCLIQGLQKEFRVTDKGDLKEDLLGVLVKRQSDGYPKLSQPQLIK
jgi:hypothetical protein